MKNTRNTKISPSSPFTPTYHYTNLTERWQSVRFVVAPSYSGGSDQSELICEPQANEPSTTAKKKLKTTKGCSGNIVELLDQSDVVSGHPPLDEPLDNNEKNEAAFSGRQRGAKNYTYAELTLLTKCMKATVPIGPHGIGDAINLYKRLAKDKGWAERGEKALRQKWDKVREMHTPCPGLIVVLQSSKSPGRKAGKMN